MQKRICTESHRLLGTSVFPFHRTSIIVCVGLVFLFVFINNDVKSLVTSLLRYELLSDFLVGDFKFHK